ncbi:3,4-dihydroxy-2-butanone-4-phosphate synthase [Gammaproteobacteria bacterium]|nr:3,4-dihydroxy-2-butanone-4-phosphate synthase [Gammaproteobacteria bacterium]
MIIVTDHPDREDEGDLIIASEKITADTMNFIIRYSSGIVCLPMQEDQLKKLILLFFNIFAAK